MAGTARRETRSSPMRSIPIVDGVALVATEPSQTVVLERNPTGTAHWGFVCAEPALAPHLDALVTRVAADALGCADAAVKIPVQLREEMGDTLRMLLKPPKDGRLWDAVGLMAEPYRVECRPNHYTTSLLTDLVRARHAGAAAQASPGVGRTAPWTSGPHTSP